MEEFYCAFPDFITKSVFNKILISMYNFHQYSLEVHIKLR